MIKESVEIHPIFIEVDRFYTVEFYNEGQRIHTSVVEYLFDAELPPFIPTKPQTESKTYTFVGWNKDITKVTENLKVDAVYTESLRKFLVTFYDGNGTIFNSQYVEYGKHAITQKVCLQKPIMEIRLTSLKVGSQITQALLEI